VRVPVRVAEGPAADLSADPDQLDQLLINLVRNAADAALETGGGVAVTWVRAAPATGSSGAAVLQVIITPWWLLCVLLLALFLGLGKRRNELMVLESGAGSHRRILEEYSSQLLDNLIVIVVACTILTYSFATFSAPSAPTEPFPFLMLSIPFVIYAMFRYMYLMYRRDEGGTPEEMLLRDRPLFLAIISWGVLVVAILLLFSPR